MRYDQWEMLRENAIANRKASGATGPLPRALTEAPPPRPPPPEDDDMTDVSVELQNGAGMDSFASDGPGSGGPFQMETAPVDRTEMIVRTSALLLRGARSDRKANPTLSRTPRSRWATRSSRTARRRQPATPPTTRTSGARARCRSTRRCCATCRPTARSRARTACSPRTASSPLLSRPPRPHLGSLGRSVCLPPTTTPTRKRTLPPFRPPIARWPSTAHVPHPPLPLPSSSLRCPSTRFLSGQPVAPLSLSPLPSDRSLHPPLAHALSLARLPLFLCLCPIIPCPSPSTPDIDRLPTSRSHAR